MEIKDLIITPLILILIYAVAMILRGRFTDRVTRVYFIPALTLKLIGAIAVGLVYQFYYTGGDTFNYYYYPGSSVIWDAFLDSPLTALRLIFGPNTYDPETFEYSRRIITYKDSNSYFIVRLAGFFGLFTVNTYSSIACLFASTCFAGLWAMYRGFYRLYPHLHKGLAIAIFFIPSVFFWGSGILKDTITLGAVGLATYGFLNLIHRRRLLFSLFWMLIGLYVLFAVKIYILLSFLPAALFWFGLDNVRKIKSPVIRILVAPLLISIMLGLGYQLVQRIGQGDKQYALDSVTATAEITARYLYRKSLIEGGSAYNLGDFDYSPAGITRKVPLAIWVTLFRPYIWESNNVVMLLSAMESLFFLLFTVYTIIRTGFFRFLGYFIKNPEVSFSLLFSLFFSFAVGFVTYNFGSLVRYKIPMMPFYIIAMLLVLDYANSLKKRGVLASTEK